MTPFSYATTELVSRLQRSRYRAALEWLVGPVFVIACAGYVFVKYPLTCLLVVGVASVLV